MSDDSTVSKIRALRERLLPEVEGQVDFPEPSPTLDLASREGSPSRQFKHLHQGCVLHREICWHVSRLKHLYYLDAYLDLSASGNPLALYPVARGMLELNAHLHEISTRLAAAADLARESWLDGGKKFFSDLVRARFGTSNPEYREVLEEQGVSKRLLKPMNVMHAIEGLSTEPGFEDTGERYAWLCDFVHQNLGIGTATSVGSGVSDAARSSGGGKIVYADGRPVTITRYEYPVPAKAQRAIEHTGEGFLQDANASVRWLNDIPESPFTPEQIQEWTGTTHGFARFEPPPTTSQPRSATRRKIGRNEACPCGSGKKYKKCCLPE